MIEYSKVESIINDNTLTAREKYRLIYNEETTRDRARHAIDKLKATFNGWVKKEMVSTPQKETFTINSDGSRTSEKYLRCSEEDITCPEFLLVKHGFNPDKFSLISARSSVWDGNLGEGKEVLYSSKISVKPKDYSKDIKALVEKSVNDLYTNGFADISVKNETENTSTNFLEVCFPDLHIGLTDRSGNSDYFPQYKFLSDVSSYIKNNIKKYNKIVLAFLGDIFHYDTKLKTTTAGTQQESNMSFESMYSYAVRYFTTFIDIIYKASCENNTKIDIIYVPGNHDEILGYTLMALLQQLYNKSNIEFDISNEYRKYIKLGNNIIGYTHGDMSAKNISRWIYNDAANDLANVSNIEIHAGHLHHEQVFEDGGVTVRYLPSLAETSPWEKSKGYSHKRCGMIFDWGYDGLNEIKYFGYVR